MNEFELKPIVYKIYFVIYLIISIYEKYKISHKIFTKAYLFNNFSFVNHRKKMIQDARHFNFFIKNNILHVNYDTHTHTLYIKENIDYFYFEIYFPR